MIVGLFLEVYVCVCKMIFVVNDVINGVIWFVDIVKKYYYVNLNDFVNDFSDFYGVLFI